MNRLIRRYRQVFAAAAFLLLAPAPRARATTALGFDVSGGVGASGYDTSASYDVRTNPDSEPWELSLSYAYLHSTLETESKTDQYVGQVSHSFNDSWDGHAGLTYWDDSINKIHYEGPSVGVTYTWNTEEDSSDVGGKTVDTPPSSEILDISLNLDIFAYATEVVESSTSVRVGKKLVHINPRNTIERTTQYHPSLTLNKPLFNAAVTPYVTYGYDFYSEDPSGIENLVGQPLYESTAGRIGALTGGFFRNEGETGLKLNLPWQMKLVLRVAAQQSYIDNTWATTQEVTLTDLFFDHLRSKLDWSRSIQAGISSDLFTGGLSWEF